MTSIRSLFGGHLIALVFVLGGLLIALPHPELWAGSRYGADVFSFGMTYAGPLQILLGAATMLVFGIHFLGLRRTLTFFVTTVVFSLAAELIGTGTGWPFGNYAYNDGLGFKVLGKVPFTIPLSWFSLGFSAYLLGTILAATRIKRHRAIWSVAIGAYLLTVWDLVLDPAMAHPDMPIRFWTWFESGPYFGMPAQNFVGWTLTGVLFMTVSRLLWRRDAGASEFPAWVPLGIYLANMVFAIALSLSVGLWQPTVVAVLFGCVPALFAWWSQRKVRPALSTGRHSIQHHPTRVSHSVMRAGAKAIVSRRLELTVEGESNLPASGPVMIVSRHYHHLYDGCALMATVRRPVHVLVGLDWIESSTLRRVMERLCRMAGWPVVLRPDGLERRAGRSAFQPDESRRYLRQAIRESVDLLRAGEALVVFPEGYPVVDPGGVPARDSNEFLPFCSGFLGLVERAQRDGCRVPIVPVGLAYQADDNRRMVMRVGSPVFVDSASDRGQLLRDIEQSVQALSRPVAARETSSFQEAIQR